MKNLNPALFGVFALGASIILFEITLTRVFSIMMWHHFTYMVISIALLGFGAAGSFLTIRKKEADENPYLQLRRYSGFFTISLVLAFGCATVVEVDTLALLDDPRNILGLLLLYAIIAVPMFFGGLAMGYALSHFSKAVNKVYFLDLLGSALGGGASIFILSHWGSTATVFASAFVAALACLGFSFGIRASQRILPFLLCLATCWTFLAYSGGVEKLGIPALRWDPAFAKGKEMTILKVGVEQRIPGATAEVEVSESHSSIPMIGGDFSYAHSRLIQGRFVTQDGTAPTILYKDAADLKRFDFLDDSQAGTAYVALKARGKENPNVLVIGVGGGVDVMMALAEGAKKVTAVEINEAMIRMVTEDYADYLGGLFQANGHPLADRIELIRGEGRSYMRHHDAKYDVIQMSGVDSFTALNTGAYTLSESYLYTVEAVKEFYEHLEDDGIINYSRFILSRPKKPRETLRLANVAWTALSEMGIKQPASHIAIVQGYGWASTMIRKRPFSTAEMSALHAFTNNRGFQGVVFDPLLNPDDTNTSVANAKSGLVDYFRLTLKGQLQALPPNDQSKLDIETIAESMAITTMGIAESHKNVDDAAVEAVVSSLSKDLRPRLAKVLRNLVVQAVKYLKNTVQGFSETRQDFQTLLTGSTEERREFMKNYPYELSACRDDNPFFFSYYKWQEVFNNSQENQSPDTNQNIYHPEFPVGHAVLLASLLQILVLAVVMILSPLKKLRRAGVATTGKLRYLAFFAALGSGFMFAEIVMMQKLVIFLGHPTYATSVVLSSLLGFAGLGSMLAGKIKRISGATMFGLLVFILSAIALQVLGFQKILPTMLGESFPLRIVISVAILLPLGLALGTAFPSGIRALSTNCPALVPWAWAVNGFSSVIASILCIVISQEIGFTKVLYLSAVIYAVGFALMIPERQELGPAAATAAE